MSLFRLSIITSFLVVIVGCQMPVSGSGTKASSSESTVSYDSVENFEESSSQLLTNTDHSSFAEKNEIIVLDALGGEDIEASDEVIVETEVFQEEFIGIDSLQDEVVEVESSQQEVITLNEVVEASEKEIGDLTNSNLVDEANLEVAISTEVEVSEHNQREEDIANEETALAILPPIAKSDNYTINQSQFQRLNILENDINIDGEVKITIESQANNGLVELSNDGYVTYSPNELFFGKDEFVYKVTNQNGESSIASTALNVLCEINCSTTFKLSWDESLSPDVIGYNVYLGRSSDELDTVFELGNVSQFEFLAESKGAYYFAVAAVNSQGMESELTQSVYGVF